MSMRPTARGAEALFAAALTYAFTGVLVRVVTPMWGTNAQVAVRWLLAFFILLALTHAHKPATKLTTKQVALMSANAILFALVVLFFTAAVEHTTIANTLFVFYATNMIMSFMLGSFLLREHVTLAKLLALGFALAGLSVYAQALVNGNLGLLLSLAAGLSEAACNVLRKQLRPVSRGTVLRFQYGIGTVFTVLVTLISSQPILKHVDLYHSLMTVVFALVILASGYLVLYGFQHFDINIGTVILSTELVFGALLGWLLFNEIPAAHEVVGGSLIFVAAIVTSGVFDQSKPNQPLID